MTRYARIRCYARLVTTTGFVKDAADMWKMSERMVRKYCEQDRIDGAIHAGNVWVIPAKAKRPSEMKDVEIPLTAFAKHFI